MIKFKIRCPGCSAESALSLIEAKYQGPFRCWQCRALFSIALEDGELKSCEPLSPAEFEELQRRKEAERRSGK